jgi:sec-independent protein translocase protein TatA
MTDLLPASDLLAFGLPGGYEWVVLLVLGLLIFGRRLPEVGRSLGKGIIEFKKGIKGIEDEIDEASSPPAQIDDQPAPRLEEPTATTPRTATQASVGNEGPNPYAPAEEPTDKS